MSTDPLPKHHVFEGSVKKASMNLRSHIKADDFFPNCSPLTIPTRTMNLNCKKDRLYGLFQVLINFRPQNLIAALIWFFTTFGPCMLSEKFSAATRWQTCTEPVRNKKPGGYLYLKNFSSIIVTVEYL